MHPTCSKLRDELLAREIFYTMREAKTLIEWWRIQYNTIRPHSSLGYKPPAPKAVLPKELIPIYHKTWQHELPLNPLGLTFQLDHFDRAVQNDEPNL